ncbi:hypothetical protein Vadar_005876 [Vaccinium darrowii]|uniref:Uncharacterized protein n=1 Tax=Vaccinium darrowii TaxID=229202 RepID=A0ACB7YCY8_9ERIC|nr:hypothetical protein Vadar_005876 [Vaccinium darrowii]
MCRNEGKKNEAVAREEGWGRDRTRKREKMGVGREKELGVGGGGPASDVGGRHRAIQGKDHVPCAAGVLVLPSTMTPSSYLPAHQSNLKVLHNLLPLKSRRIKEGKEQTTKKPLETRLRHREAWMVAEMVEVLPVGRVAKLWKRHQPVLALQVVLPRRWDKQLEEDCVYEEELQCANKMQRWTLTSWRQARAIVASKKELEFNEVKNESKFSERRGIDFRL